MASRSYADNFDSRVDDLLSGKNLSDWGVDTTPLHATATSSPAGGSSDRSAAVGSSPRRPRPTQSRVSLEELAKFKVEFDRPPARPNPLDRSRSSHH